MRRQKKGQLGMHRCTNLAEGVLNNLKKLQDWYSEVSTQSEPVLDKQLPLGQVLDQARPLVGSTPGSPTPSWTTWQTTIENKTQFGKNFACCKKVTTLS